MNEAIGEKVVYLITQINSDTNNEAFVEYNEYNGSFMASTLVGQATRFNLAEQAIDLAKLQNQMAKLLNKRFSYRAIKEVVTRSEVYAEVVVEEPSTEA